MYHTRTSVGRMQVASGRCRAGSGATNGPVLAHRSKWDGFGHYCACKCTGISKHWQFWLSFYKAFNKHVSLSIPRAGVQPGERQSVHTNFVPLLTEESYLTIHRKLGSLFLNRYACSYLPYISRVWLKFLLFPHNWSRCLITTAALSGSKRVTLLQLLVDDDAHQKTKMNNFALLPLGGALPVE